LGAGLHAQQLAQVVGGPPAAPPGRQHQRRNLQPPRVFQQLRPPGERAPEAVVGVGRIGRIDHQQVRQVGVIAALEQGLGAVERHGLMAQLCERLAQRLAARTVGVDHPHQLARGRYRGQARHHRGALGPRHRRRRRAHRREQGRRVIAARELLRQRRGPG